MPVRFRRSACALQTKLRACKPRRTRRKSMGGRARIDGDESATAVSPPSHSPMPGRPAEGAISCARLGGFPRVPRPSGECIRVHLGFFPLLKDFGLSLEARLRPVFSPS
ncbi:hypothetical protein OH77DRAFT_1049254 [Trametes cingulata]|nr:hypothetical protein OH77DRAFT_1049254 [Trametes cingulata]